MRRTSKLATGAVHLPRCGQLAVTQLVANFGGCARVAGQVVDDAAVLGEDGKLVLQVDADGDFFVSADVGRGEGGEER